MGLLPKAFISTALFACSAVGGNDLTPVGSKWLLLRLDGTRVEVESASLSSAPPASLLPHELCLFDPVPIWCSHEPLEVHPHFGYVSLSAVLRETSPAPSVVAVPILRQPDPRRSRFEWFDDSGRYGGAFSDNGTVDELGDQLVGHVAARVPLDAVAVAVHFPPPSHAVVSGASTGPGAKFRSASAAAQSLARDLHTVVVSVPTVASLSTAPVGHMLGAQRRSASALEVVSARLRAAASAATDGQCTEWGAFGCPEVVSDVHVRPTLTLNLVIVPAGFTTAERGTFLSAANDVRAAFRTTEMAEPFRRYSGLINIHTVWLAALESGVSEPVKGVDRSGSDPLRCSYGATAATERGVQCDKGRVLSLASYAPTAMTPNAARTRGVVGEALVLVIVNSDTYGGTGSAGVATVALMSAGDRPKMLNVAVHELGHAQGGLADEYSYGGTSRARLYWPNCAPSAEDEKAAWNAWMVKGATPFATGVALRTNEVAFPAGDALSTPRGSCIFDNFFRPSGSCIMSSNTHQRFCPACRQGLVVSLYRSGLALLNAACPFPTETTVVVHGTPWEARLNALVGASLKVAGAEDTFVVVSYVGVGNTLVVDILQGPASSSVSVPSTVLGLGTHTVNVSVIDATRWVPEAVRLEQSAMYVVPRAAWRTILSSVSVGGSYTAVNVSGSLRGAFSSAAVSQALEGGALDRSDVFVSATGSAHSMIQRRSFVVEVVADEAAKTASGCARPTDARCAAVEICTVCRSGDCKFDFESQPFDVAIVPDELPKTFWIALSVAVFLFVCAGLVLVVSYGYIKSMLDSHPKPLRPEPWQERAKHVVMGISALVAIVSIVVLFGCLFTYPELELFLQLVAAGLVVGSGVMMLVGVMGFPSAHLEWRVMLTIACVLDVIAFILLLIVVVGLAAALQASSELSGELDVLSKVDVTAAVSSGSVSDNGRIAAAELTLSSSGKVMYDWMRDTWKDAIVNDPAAVCAFQGSYSCSGFQGNCLAFDDRILEDSEAGEALCPRNCDIGNANAEPCLNVFVDTVEKFSGWMVWLVGFATFTIFVAAILHGVLACTIHYRYYRMTPDGVKKALNGTPEEIGKRVAAEIAAMHPDDLTKMREEFKRCDTEEPYGKVNATELFRYLRNVLRWDVNKDFAVKLIKGVDDERNGWMEYDEFLALHTKVEVDDVQDIKDQPFSDF